MARQARGEVFDPTQVQVLHCVQRCVRRAFLCEDDPYSGKSYEHRREWTRQRLEFLASAFGIDCLTYTVLSNHMHVVLRSRPDVVRQWSNRNRLLVFGTTFRQCDLDGSCAGLQHRAALQAAFLLRTLFLSLPPGQSVHVQASSAGDQPMRL